MAYTGSRAGKLDLIYASKGGRRSNYMDINSHSGFATFVSNMVHKY